MPSRTLSEWGARKACHRGRTPRHRRCLAQQGKEVSMGLDCFFVPARVPEPAQSELNQFLAATVTCRVASRTTLQDIDGIGVAQADKYSLAGAQDRLGALRAHFESVLGLKLKPGARVQPSGQGVCFYGFRVRGAFPDDALERAAAGLTTTLLPAQSLDFQRSLWWPDRPEACL